MYRTGTQGFPADRKSLALDLDIDRRADAEKKVRGILVGVMSMIVDSCGAVERTRDFYSSLTR